MGRNQTKTDGDWLTVRVAGITDETNLVRTYELVHPSGDMLPAFTAGAHTNVLLPSGLIRQYSLFNDAAETHRYCIAVQRENNGRGGSIEMHEKIRVGDCLQISATNNHFPLSGAAGAVPANCRRYRHYTNHVDDFTAPSGAGGLGLTLLYPNERGHGFSSVIERTALQRQRRAAPRWRRS